MAEAPTHPRHAEGESLRRSIGRFTGYVAVACGVAALFLLSWDLREVLLLGFGSIVVAVVIRSVVRPLAAHARMGEKWAVAAVVVTLLLLASGLSWLFGQQVAEQLQGLRDQLPAALDQTRAWLERNAAGSFLLERLANSDGSTEWLQTARRFAAISATTIAHMVLILFAGIYIAASPGVYLNGVIRLFPQVHRKTILDALLASGKALRRWLLGQLLSMISVGCLTGLGLWLVGAPLPLALGIVAGVLEFVPVIGPVVAAIPAILVAFTASPQTALYVVLVCLAVQQIEGNVIMPLAQRWAVALPAALGLIAIVAFGTLFGFLGVLFASPLAVVVVCLVQKLYVNHALGDNADAALTAPT